MADKCTNLIPLFMLAEHTLPAGVLVPTFTGNADYVDDESICFVMSRRQSWFDGFPRLERPCDE